MRRLTRVLAALAFAAAVVMVAVGTYMHFNPAPEPYAPEPEHSYTAADADTYVGPSPQDLIAGIEDGTGEWSWNQDGEAASTWDEAMAMEGAAVFIPSVGIASPMTATDTDGAQLILPEPPRSTWYKRTAQIGADQGSSVVASHVNHGYGQLAPFSRLHKIDKGAPILVRDFEKNWHVYKATEIDVYHQTALPRSLFRGGGDHVLNLVTCSGRTVERGGERYFFYNLVVGAVPVSDEAETVQLLDW